MLQVDTFGPITRITLARRLAGVAVRSVCVYLIDGLLIDSGQPAVAAELCAWLRDRGLRQVFNTHHHEDHAGGDALIQRELGVPVAAGSAAVHLIANLPRIQFYRAAVWGRPENATVDVNDGPVSTPHYCFEVVPTPGHSPDHVCLFERKEGWLFAGDLYVHERVRYLRPDEDLGLEVASLRKAVALQPRVLFCAHTGVITEPAAAIGRKLAFWAGIRRDASRLRDRGASMAQVVRGTLGREDVMTLLSRGHFSKATLVRALLALGDDVLPMAGG